MNSLSYTYKKKIIAFVFECCSYFFHFANKDLSLRKIEGLFDLEVATYPNISIRTIRKEEKSCLLCYYDYSFLLYSIKLFILIQKMKKKNIIIILLAIY